MANALNTSEALPELGLAQFFTPALRSWLVNYLLPDSLASEMRYALLELHYDELPAELHKAAAMRDFLKREMSQLAARQRPEAARQLLQLCEQVVQLYLLQHPAEAAELAHLNQLLPPGVSFSLVSGRLLFEPALYFQPHNLYDQEQTLFAHPPLPSVALTDKGPAAHVKMSQDRNGSDPASDGAATKQKADGSQDRSGSDPASDGAATKQKADGSQTAQQPAAPTGVQPIVKETPPPEADAAGSASPESLPRHQRLRQIRERRLQLLKEWES